jgi:uncharacterized protein YxeA
MKRLLLMLISLAAMTAMPAPAYADDPPTDNDAAFLKQMTSEGLTYKDATQTVAVAKNVCDMANKGTSEAEIEKKLEAVNSFSGNGAKKFIMVAATAYCPKQLSADDGGSEPPKSPGQ